MKKWIPPRITVHQLVEKGVKCLVSLMELSFTLMNKSGIINKGVFPKSAEVSDVTILPHCIFR